MGYQGEINGPNAPTFNIVGRHSLPARADTTPSPTIPSKLCGNNVTDSSKSVTQTPKNNDRTRGLKRPERVEASLQNSEVRFTAKNTHSVALNPQRRTDNVSKMPPNVEDIIQPHPNSKTAEVVNQRQAVYRNVSSSKRQRFEKGDDADDIYVIKEKIKRPRASTDTTPSPTIPSKLHRNNVADSSKSVAQTPKNNDSTRGLNRPENVEASPQDQVRRVEQVIENKNNERSKIKQVPVKSKNSSNVKFHREIVPASEISYFDTFENLKLFLQLATLRSKEKELKKYRKTYNKHEDTSCNKYTEQLEKFIQELEQQTNYCKKIRKNISKKLACTIVGKLQCKNCSKKYSSEACFITHVLDYHPEKIVENFESDKGKVRPKNSTNINVAASETNALADSVDDASTISFNPHSPSSQITLSNPMDLPGNTPVYAPVLCDDTPNTTSLTNTSNPKFIEIVPIDRVDNRSSTKTADPMPTDLNENSDAVVNNIRVVLRKPINLFGSESFKLFEEESKKIKLWLKKPNKSTEIGCHKNLKKDKIKNCKSRDTNTVDDNAPMKRYYMAVIYSEDELNRINHCYNLNPNASSLCKDCHLNLVKYQANVYAQSNKAFKEQEKILNNETLNKADKKETLKELYKKDEYRLIRMRLETIRNHRETFNLMPDLVRYNNKYFKMLEKAFNDQIFQELVGLNLRNGTKFQFGVFCGKLMDDIANEFLVHVTATCMNFAHNDKRIMLSEEYLRRYQLLFQTTNKDATYFEQFPSLVTQHVKTKYEDYLPKTKNLEVIITDCLLRYSFCDIDSLHENLDNLIFEHLKSPQPIFKFLMYMKFSRKYLTSLKSLLLKFLAKIAIKVLQLKKQSNSGHEVSYNELIEACEIVGVFSSSYTHYLKRAYGQYYEKLRQQLDNNVSAFTRDSR